jgi:ABC-type lipoprotein export system ATPase subunit
MPNDIAGATWKKWDLHVHTPASIVHHYPGKEEEAWEAFFADLEALPAEFKVLGINDYLFVDGYERVLKAKRELGRLANIDLILPVVELRLDKFGGVVKGGKDGYSQSGWSRINLHVIFDQVEPALIREQFLSAISPSYKLVPGSSGEGKWGGVITRGNLEALGRAIIDSLPEGEKVKYGAPLKEGFNNLNISLDGLKDALKNPHLAGRHLVAIGKTEWENLKWDDHTIAEKKTLINEADLVFTAAENPESYAKGRAKLIESKVNACLLDCSDAHHPKQSAEKDRIGNCFTWIKADATFQGLLQALNEFDDRVFVGDVPPKSRMVDQNRTKFIQSVKVSQKAGSTLAEAWFDVDLPLSPDLVAIIGNKGSGKSALSDIIALTGNTKNFGSFSFLNANRFRNPRMRLAQHFECALVWCDGAVTTMDLDKDPDPSSVERVKYLPQSYLETLCNELGEGGSSTFDSELRKIIYSHVPEEDRLGQASMDNLLDFKVSEISDARKAVVREIAKVNAEIIQADRRLTPEFKKGLEEQLVAKKAELAALDAAKPQPVDDPNESPEAQVESKKAAAQVEQLELSSQGLAKEDADLRERKAQAAKRQALSKRIAQALANQRKQHDAFQTELEGLLAELGAGIAARDLVELRIESGAVDKVAAAAAAEIAEVDSKLQSAEPGSLVKRREEVAAAISASKAMLGERQRQYVRFKEELAQWEKAKAELLGSKDRNGSIAWIDSEIASLESIPGRLSELRAKRIELAKGVHAYIASMVGEYQRLYEPVQTFVKSAEQMDMKLPLDFEVKIEEAEFQDQFLNRLNRQARGSFSGIDESNQRVRALLQEAQFSTAEAAVAFAERIDDMLSHDRREEQGRDTRLADQLRKGVEPQDILDFLYGFDYLAPRYSLTYDKQEIGQLSPGERGLLLLVFYLLVDKADIPIVIDQPEENLDNQTIFNVLVKCVKKAKERRQVIMVTHNPNLAVVCDAEQIIHAHCDKVASRFLYEAGAIEHPNIMAKVVQVLEGTEPAFKNRQSKYKL